MSQVQISQPTGAGTPDPDKTLEDAWIGKPITFQLPAGATNFLHTILDATDGENPSIVNASSQTATITPTRIGAFRWQGQYVLGGVTYQIRRVVVVTKDETGVESAKPVAPPYLTRPEEVNGSRGPQDLWDRALGKLEASLTATGAATSMADTDETLSSVPRRFIAAMAGPVRTKTLPNGSRDGERRTIQRRITNKARLRFVNEDGSHVTWLNRTGSLELEWDATASKWVSLNSDRIEKVFRPEDFGPGVGVGNATADRAALVAMFAAMTDFANQSDNELAAAVQLSTLYFVTSGVDVSGTDYTAIRIHGTSPSGNGGFRGCGIKFTGSTAVAMTGAPSLTFNRAARTIVRSGGTGAASFVADGFTAGMRILVQDPTSGSILNNRIYEIETVTASTITVVAPAATYPTVGYATDGMMPWTEGPLANFVIVQASHVLRVKGASGVVLEDLVIDGDHKALFPVWADIVPDDPNATNLRQVRIDRCSVFGHAPFEQGANIYFGRPGSAPAVGSDLNNTWVTDTVCQNTYGTRYGACIRYADGNNTKLHRVIGCELWSSKLSIDHGSASEGISVQDTHFEDADVAVYNNGYLEMSNCHSERVGMSVDGVRGRTLENNNSWNLSGSFIVARQNIHEMHRCTYINGNVTMLVGSINTGTGIVTAANSSARVPANGDEVVVRPATGWLGMPGITQPTWHDRASQIFYLGDVTDAGGGNYTFSLRQSRTGSPGSYVLGAAVTFTSGGSGNIWIVSPAMFVTTIGLSKPAGDGQSVSFDSCCIMGALDVPHVGTVQGESVFDPYGASTGTYSGKASVRHSFGFTPGPVLQALAEISTVPMFGNAQLVPQITYYAEQTEWVLRGVDGWSILRVRAASLASGTFKAGAFAIFYVDLPYRCGVEMVTSEVPTSFAAPGLTAATVKIGHVDVGQGDGDDDDAYLLTTSLMTFPNASDRRKGFATGERGVRLATPPYWPKYTGATDWGWNNRMAMIVRIDLTGANLSALTAGDLLLGFKLVQAPDWKRS